MEICLKTGLELCFLHVHAVYIFESRISTPCMYSDSTRKVLTFPQFTKSTSNSK